MFTQVDETSDRVDDAIEADDFFSSFFDKNVAYFLIQEKAYTETVQTDCGLTYNYTIH